MGFEKQNPLLSNKRNEVNLQRYVEESPEHTWMSTQTPISLEPPHEWGVALCACRIDRSGRSAMIVENLLTLCLQRHTQLDC